MWYCSRMKNTRCGASLDATTAGEQFRCHAAGAQLANLRVFFENGRRAVLSVLSEAAQFNLLSPSHFLLWPQFLLTFVIFRRKEARKWSQEKRKGRKSNVKLDLMSCWSLVSIAAMLKSFEMFGQLRLSKGVFLKLPSYLYFIMFGWLCLSKGVFLKLPSYL